jgi:hypothetical protein
MIHHRGVMVHFPSIWIVVIALLALFLGNATVTVDGAGVIAAFTLTGFVLVGALMYVLRDPHAVPVTQRPVDFIIVLVLIAFAVTAVLVDAVQVWRSTIFY